MATYTVRNGRSGPQTEGVAQETECTCNHRNEEHPQTIQKTTSFVSLAAFKDSELA